MEGSGVQPAPSLLLFNAVDVPQNAGFPLLSKGEPPLLSFASHLVRLSKSTQQQQIHLESHKALSCTCFTHGGHSEAPWSSSNWDKHTHNGESGIVLLSQMTFNDYATMVRGGRKYSLLDIGGRKCIPLLLFFFNQF